MGRAPFRRGAVFGSGNAGTGAWLTRGVVGCDEHREYLLEACYRRRMGGWHLDRTGSFGDYERLPERGWRRVLALWSNVHVPFFRAFGA